MTTSKDLIGMSDKELSELEFYLTSHDDLNASMFVNRFRTFFGKSVTVVKGRKVPHGTKGVVNWMGSKYFNYSYFPTTSVRIDCEDGAKYFTNIDNIVLNQEGVR